MGKVNNCLKRTYIIVISLITIMGALLLAFAIFCHGYLLSSEEIEEMSLHIREMYLLSTITLLLTITGLYGACKEKQQALFVFAVGMTLSNIYIIAMDSFGLAQHWQAIKIIERQYLTMLPLANGSASLLQDLQMDLQCCGLDQGYMDWGYNIPISCLCTEESINPCVAAPRNSSLFKLLDKDKPIMIYKEPCLQYITKDERNFTNVALGLWLGGLSLWVWSVILDGVILCQLRRKEDTPQVLCHPEAKAADDTAFACAAENP